MALAAGMITGYVVSQGDAFWTFQGGLGGIITASAGNDLYYPYQAFFRRRLWCLVRVQAPFLGREEIPHRRRGGSGRDSRLLRFDRCATGRLLTVGLPQFADLGLRPNHTLGTTGGRRYYVLCCSDLRPVAPSPRCCDAAACCGSHRRSKWRGWITAYGRSRRVKQRSSPPRSDRS